MKQEHSLQIFLQNVNRHIPNKFLWSYLQKTRHQVLLKETQELQTLYQDLQKSKHFCEEDRNVVTDTTDTLLQYTLSDVPSL